MQDVDVPIPEPGAPQCTVGLNAAGEQLLPVAPRLETDPTPHNVDADAAPDSARHARPPALSTTSTVPCEAAAAAVGAGTAMPAQQTTPRGRQLVGLRQNSGKKVKKMACRKGVSHDANLKAASAERNLASCDPVRCGYALRCQGQHTCYDCRRKAEEKDKLAAKKAAAAAQVVVQQQKLQEEKDKLATTDRRFKVVYKPTESRLQRQRDDQLNAEFTRKAEASTASCWLSVFTQLLHTAAAAAFVALHETLGVQQAAGLHASCWQSLGGEALPVDCWSCADLDQSIVPWSCRCVTFADV